MNRSIIAIVLALAGAASLASCRKSSSNTTAASEAVSVRTRTVSRMQTPVTVSASGSVEGLDTIDTAFQVSGRILRVHVQEGDQVAKGQLLAEIDPTDYRLGVQAASAQAGVARATYDKALAGTRAEELEQARVAYERAADEYNRMKTLYEKKSLAPNDFRKFEAAYLAARARFEEARNGARTEDRQAARAGVEQAEAGAGIARKRLSDTRLYAPIGGKIARRGVDPGEMVQAGMPVFSIVDLSPVKVRVGVPEADIGRIRRGQKATILVPALRDLSFEGIVSLVGVAADPASRTYTVKIDLPNPDTVLRTGMIAEARIQTDGSIEALTVPGEAIVRDPQGITLVYVYFPDQKRAYARRVETGSVHDREVEIRSGLKGDELIVVAGQNKLREGSPVDAVEETK